MTKWLKLVLLIVLVGILFLGFRLKLAWGEKEVVLPLLDTETPIMPSLPQKTALQEWFRRLESMENCPLEGVMDSGSLSYGAYCFKKSTYLAEARKIYPEAEEAELLSNLSDKWTQEQIILAWIKENPELLKQHFFTSVVVRKLGLPYD